MWETLLKFIQDNKSEEALAEMKKIQTETNGTIATLTAKNDSSESEQTKLQTLIDSLKTEKTEIKDQLKFFKEATGIHHANESSMETLKSKMSGTIDTKELEEQYLQTIKDLEIKVVEKDDEIVSIQNEQKSMLLNGTKQAQITSAIDSSNITNKPSAKKVLLEKINGTTMIDENMIVTPYKEENGIKIPLVTASGNMTLTEYIASLLDDEFDFLKSVKTKTSTRITEGDTILKEGELSLEEQAKRNAEMYGD